MPNTIFKISDLRFVLCGGIRNKYLTLSMAKQNKNSCINSKPGIIAHWIMVKSNDDKTEHKQPEAIVVNVN